jgi:hypothetical protein
MSKSSSKQKIDNLMGWILQTERSNKYKKKPKKVSPKSLEDLED